MNPSYNCRGRPKEFDVEDTVILSMHHFWRHGYAQTNLASLLLAMNISKSSFYATFGSKEKIFLRSLDCYVKNMSSDIIKMKVKFGIKKTLLKIVRSYINEANEKRHFQGCFLNNSLQECSFQNNDLLVNVKASVNEMNKVFETLIEEGQMNAEISSDKLAIVLRGCYSNMLNGLLHSLKANEDKELIDVVFNNIDDLF